MTEKIEINGIIYVREDTISGQAPSGPRAVVVADRGFIYVGQMTVQEDGSLVLADASNIRKWARGGIGGLLSDPVASEAVLDAVAYPVLFPSGTVLQIIRVPDTWGMEAAP